MKKEELKKILKLDERIDIIKIENEDNKLLVSIRSNKKKVRCPYCNEFSSKIHDYLKPTRVDYLSIYEKPVYLIAYKRRFECSKCKKSFTENLGLTNKNANISLLTKRSILKDCMDRDKTIKQIAYDNNVSEDFVRVTFLEAVKNYPDTITNLPEVISFDEVSTYTSEGVYSFILNDPIHRYTLDILKSRKKDFLIEYFLKVNNRKSVKFVICDLYKPYYEVVKTCFPNAIFVADPFHYTRYIEEGLDNVRMKLVHKYEDNKNSKEYRLIKSRTSKGLLLKSFNETKYELKIKQEREEKYKKGLLIFPY
ncbi:MAG: transposase, partial [Bacilli bacterium]|nr:transposase [Bacilli bacterium]